MKVLIDALSARERGGQTYLKNLLAFVPRDGSVEILLLAPESLELGFEHPHVSRRAMSPRLINPFWRAAWQKLRIPGLMKEWGGDVLFCPGGLVNAGAPRGCITVTMFRNMIPFDPEQRRRYPLGYDRLRNWLLRRGMLRSMLGADLVIFISQYAKQVVERQARGRSIASVVVPHGIARQFRPESAPLPVHPAYGSGYLLYVSYIDFYKAQLEVVQAYARLKASRGSVPKLLLVGPENPQYATEVRAEIGRAGLVGDVIVTGPMPYEALPTMYRHALINIFASESENCPNILLEALASGRPIVSSARPPMPEFGGNAVLYFEPRSPADLADKLASLLDEPQRMTDYGERGLEQSQLYRWETSAARTWEAIAQTVRSKRTGARGGLKEVH